MTDRITVNPAQNSDAPSLPSWMGEEAVTYAQAGATAVHMRIVSPEVLWPCFYGIDTDTRDQLIAANLTNEETVSYTHLATRARPQTPSP